MSVEIIGMMTTHRRSEIRSTLPPVVDCNYVARFARAHEAAGFDRILVPQHGTGPDAAQVVAYASTVTRKVHFLLAHRPHFDAPAFAARQLATLENFTGGRLAVHIASGGSDARTSEYLDFVRKTWTSERPFDHAGAHYRYKMAYSEVKPLQKPHLPIWLGGASDLALRVAGEHADSYVLGGGTLDQARELTRRARAEAARHGRSLRFSASFLPILADTEAKARARAERILAEAGGPSNTTSLVGTPGQVAQALLQYVELGVGTLLIRGFDPLDDAIDCGRELIPRVRALVKVREFNRQLVAA